MAPSGEFGTAWGGMNTVTLPSLRLPMRTPLNQPGCDLAFDSEGALYIGCCRPDRVYRLSPSGTLDVYLDDFTGEFMTTPTNLAFGGPDLRTLYLAALAGWFVNAIETEVAGHPLARPG